MVRAQNSEAARTRRAGALLLPAEGHRGQAPPFPLPGASERELEVWAEAWRSPQAHAWAGESWRWPTVAMWVRWSVRMEDRNAPAAIGNVVVRLADQVGMTPAGLTENGWRLAESDETPSRVAPQDRRARPALSLHSGALSSLERARQRAESRDPRDALDDD